MARSRIVATITAVAALAALAVPAGAVSGQEPGPSTTVPPPTDTTPPSTTAPTGDAPPAEPAPPPTAPSPATTDPAPDPDTVEPPPVPAEAPAPPDALAETAPQPLAAGATALQPLGPCRLLDSRRTPDLGRIGPTTWRIQVTGGDCAVPPGVSAVAINLVATETSAEGFLTAWSGTTALPNVSNLNFARKNTVANSAVVPVSPDGTIDLFSSVPAAVIVDVTAAFMPVAGPVNAGRFVPLTPRRVLDTRPGSAPASGDLRVPLPVDVPADATALAVSVTAVDAAGFGFLTVHRSQSPRPDTSVVNTDELNRTRASTVLVPVDAGGFVVHRSTTTHVLVDVVGWFTGPSAPASTEGLFVPQAPVRLWDSRLSLDPIHRGGTVEKPVAPPGAGAVVINTTVVEPTGWGFLSIFASGTPLPDVSSLNYRWRQPVATMTVTRVSDRGVAVRSFAGVHGIIDLAGWFTGTPVAAVTSPPANPQPSPTTPVLFISDSSFAGIRWSGSLWRLQGAEFDNRLESCRRLVGVSCRGREGYAPRTALAELASVPVDRYEMLIMGTGYNDGASVFPSAFAQIMAMARAKGIDRVVWLTYRERVGYVSPSGISDSGAFASHNRVLRAALTSGDYPDLVLADWHRYTINRPQWLTADGVHFTSSGAVAAAQYVTRKLAALERRVCPAAVGPAAPGGWCADPDVTGPP